MTGSAYGQLDLWAYDHYHASVAGYYLSALVTFGAITGIDPQRSARRKRAPTNSGCRMRRPRRCRRVARDTLANE
jgi:hypothetical protein